MVPKLMVTSWRMIRARHFDQSRGGLTIAQASTYADCQLVIYTDCSHTSTYKGHLLPKCPGGEESDGHVCDEEEGTSRGGRRDNEVKKRANEWRSSTRSGGREGGGGEVKSGVEMVSIECGALEAVATCCMIRRLSLSSCSSLFGIRFTAMGGTCHVEGGSVLDSAGHCKTLKGRENTEGLLLRNGPHSPSPLSSAASSACLPGVFPYIAHFPTHIDTNMTTFSALRLDHLSGLSSASDLLSYQFWRHKAQQLLLISLDRCQRRVGG